MLFPSHRRSNPKAVAIEVSKRIPPRATPLSKVKIFENPVTEVVTGKIPKFVEKILARIPKRIT
jgi:hypothetical protein